METKKKKKSALDINEDYDFRFVTKLSPVLRWILVLPIGLAAIFAVHIAYGFVVNMFLKNFNGNETVNIIVYSIFCAIKYCVFTLAMVATAPVARNKKTYTAFCCAAIAVFFGVASTLIMFSMAELVDWAMVISTSIASLLGVAWAVWNIRSETNKPLAVQEEEEKTAQEM